MWGGGQIQGMEIHRLKLYFVELLRLTAVAIQGGDPVWAPFNLTLKK